ncbi:hypothetical protein HOU02_gp141 [Caulobacter phage CcrBL9]|uniref:Uncharacterized protein n=1 Tax=Caulobacter phage CcrBL9 TaxID=2283270 RepID=A0A385EDS5_9CAUD|nr:hypothetical protein HOU02_gp141 [Caulobacter phage CcrBL9]AXQ69165.1 hypothetical protein CcrBL9_gp141 [Caulobacter phage CcrBL9]
MTVRIYAPDGEPFDVPEHRAGELVLNKGFSRLPHDPNAVPLVQETPGYRETMAKAQAEWDNLQAERDYISGQEIDFANLLAGEEPQEETKPRRRRRRAQADA